MKITPLKKIGKVGKANLKANRILAERWEEWGIDFCEMMHPGCLGGMYLQNAHRHKRIFYLKKPKLLYNEKQVIRICQSCHDKIEHNPKLTKAVFDILRGPEENDKIK